MSEMKEENSEDDKYQQTIKFLDTVLGRMISGSSIEIPDNSGIFFPQINFLLIVRGLH